MSEVSEKHEVPRRRKLFVAVVIILIAIFLRTASLGHKSLWYDEAFSLSIVDRASLADVLSVCKTSVHPPLFHIFLYPFYKWHFSIYALRLMSVFSGISAVLLMFLVGREMRDKGTGFFMAAAMAVSPFAVHYSQELRMYSLLSLITSAQILVALMWLKKGSGGTAVLLALFSALAVLTQYYAVFSTTGLFLFLAVRAYQDDKMRGIKKFAVIPILALLFFSPWLPAFIEHVRTNTLSGPLSSSGSLSISAVRSDFLDLMLGIIPVGPATFLGFKSEGVNAMEIGFFLIIISILLIIGIMRMRGTRKKDQRYFLMIALTLFAPLLLTLIHILLKGRFYSRYLIVYLPLLFFWIGEGVRGLPARSLKAAAVALIGLYFLSSSLILARIDLRDVTLPASQYLKGCLSADSLIVHTNPWSFLPFRQYIHGNKQVLLNSFKVQDVDRAILNRTDFLKDVSTITNRDVWLVVSEWNFEQKSPVAESFQKSLPVGWRKESEKIFSGGLKWIRIDRYAVSASP